MEFRRVFQIFRPENLKSEYYKKVLMSFLLISCVVFMLFSLLLFFQRTGSITPHWNPFRSRPSARLSM